MRSSTLTNLLVFAAALLVRLVYLAESRDLPTFHVPIIDSMVYDQVARATANGEPMDYRFFWQPFFYPAWLTLVYKTGGTLLTAKILQAVVGALTCLLTARLGARCFDETTGRFAGLVVAFYGPLVFFEGELVAAGWATFLGAAFLLQWLRARDTPTLGQDALLGLVAALAVITRPTFIPALALALTWLTVVRFRKSPALSARHLAVMAGAFMLVIGYVAHTNHDVTGQRSPLPASGGVNLYIGNHPDPCSTLTIRPGTDWDELNRMVGRDKLGNVWENNRFFYTKAIDNLQEQPAAVLRGLGRKFLQVVNSREIPRNVDVYLARDYSMLLTVLVAKVGGFGFPFGLLLPFAILGLAFNVRRVPAPIWMFPILYAAAVVAVFVSARYRVVLVPSLAVFAVAGARAVWSRWSSRNNAKSSRARGPALRLIPVVTVGAVVLLASVPGPFCEEQIDYESETTYAVGYRKHQAGELRSAIVMYEDALRRRPDYTEVSNQLGLVQKQVGNMAAAIAVWNRAREREPTAVDVRLNLAAALVDTGRRVEGLQEYNRALADDPDNAAAHHNVAITLLDAGQTAQAIAHVTQAVRLNPDYAQVYRQIASRLKAQGKIEDARTLEQILSSQR